MEWCQDGTTFTRYKTKVRRACPSPLTDVLLRSGQEQIELPSDSRTRSVRRDPHRLLALLPQPSLRTILHDRSRRERLSPTNLRCYQTDWSVECDRPRFRASHAHRKSLPKSVESDSSTIDAGGRGGPRETRPAGRRDHPRLSLAESRDEQRRQPAPLLHQAI